MQLNDRREGRFSLGAGRAVGAARRPRGRRPGEAPRRGGAARRARPRSRKPTAARTSSSPCSRTSCATRSPPSRTASTSSSTRAPGGEQARRAQAVIDRQVGQLARLVDDLLDVTRITRNKIQLQRQRLELNELVRRTRRGPSLAVREERGSARAATPRPRPCSSTPTGTAWPRSSATCCRTPPSSPARAAATTVSVSRGRSGAARRRPRRATPASAWPRRCSRACSSPSCRPTRRWTAARAGSGSGWRW